MPLAGFKYKKLIGKLQTENYFRTTADVIVFRKGNLAIAVKGNTKETIASSTDHAEVIRKAIEATYGYHENGYSYVGRIYIAKGVYELGSSITFGEIGGVVFKGPLIIEGEAPAGEFAGEKCTVLRGKGVPAVRIENADNIWFRNISLTASETPDYAVETGRVGRIYFQGCHFWGGKKAQLGLGVLGPSSAGNIIVVENCLIIIPSVSGYEPNGIEINHDHVHIVNTNIVGGGEGTGWAIYAKSCNFMHIYGGHLNTYKGLYIYNVKWFWVDTFFEVSSDQPAFYVDPNDEVSQGWAVIRGALPTETQVSIPDARKPYILVLHVSWGKDPYPRRYGIGFITPLQLVSYSADSENTLKAPPPLRFVYTYWKADANAVYPGVINLELEPITDNKFNIWVKEEINKKKLLRITGKRDAGLIQIVPGDDVTANRQLGEVGKPWDWAIVNNVRSNDNTPLKLYSSNADIELYDWASGNLLAKVKKDGRLTIKKIDVDDYGGNFANYTPPTDAEEGDILIAVDTNSTNPGTRIYVYANGAWHHVDLT